MDTTHSINSPGLCNHTKPDTHIHTRARTHMRAHTHTFSSTFLWLHVLVKMTDRRSHFTCDIAADERIDRTYATRSNTRTLTVQLVLPHMLKFFPIPLDLSDVTSLIIVDMQSLVFFAAATQMLICHVL